MNEKVNMTQNDFTRLMEYAPQLEKLFSQSVWKKAIQPWLLSHRNRFAQDVVYSNVNQSDRDVKRGEVMALDLILNLPNAIESAKTQKKEEAFQAPQAVGDVTDYGSSMLDAPIFGDEEYEE